MTPNRLFPGYIQLQYQTGKSLHSARLPTKEWGPGGPYGGYEAWDSSNIAMDVMVQALVDAWVPSFPTETTFLDATAYHIDDPDSDVAVPMAFYVIVDGAGTSVADGVDAAQATWSFITTGGGQSRLVGLDIAPSTLFKPRRPGSFVAADTTLEAEWTASTSAWSGRDGNKPSALRQVAFTLNDALRRSYKYN